MDFSAKMLRDDALKGKVIVVTGGGSGLGKAMTKYFMELGAKVAISSRDLEKLQNTAKELETELSFTAKEAEEVVRYREKNGNFSRWEDLQKVPDLDAKKVEAVKDRLAF